jgi:TolB-like protein/DNA-binding winged helix-turn-helix (wHTH) protein/Tfp pilus assembly protein PilF
VNLKKISFGGWVVDPDSGDMERSGIQTRLQEQPLQILMELIAARGGVVTREQLVAKLWPKGVVDFDTGLNTAIRRLRVALGDTADTPRYIETLPRRGYRFIAALDVQSEAPQPVAPVPPPLSIPVQAEVGPVMHSPGTVGSGSSLPESPRPTTLFRRALLASLAAAGLVALLAVWYRQNRIEAVRHQATPVAGGITTPTADSAAGVFAPPAHSIAVLPFTNMSGDATQEYFSDGISEELLDALSGLNELQVAAGTSSFSFKGKNIDVATIARKLNVGAVLEGSVRRSGSTVRITVQLVNAVTGYHVWSQTYDRDLGDVLKLQTEIANAVAAALKVTLLGDEAARIELGGTRNPAAFDAYLRAAKVARTHNNDAKNWETAIAAFTEAIHLDPNYSLAFAGRSLALSEYAGEFASPPQIRDSFARAQADARKALELAPDLPDGHLALALSFEWGSLDFVGALKEYDRALMLAPGNVMALSMYGRFMAVMGRTDPGIAAARRAVRLDPLNPAAHGLLGVTFLHAGRSREAIASYQDALALDPEAAWVYGELGQAYCALGDLQRAQSICEAKPESLESQECLASTYYKLGRHTDAEAILAKLRASYGESNAQLFASTYAEWGNKSKALEWLAIAVRVRDPGLETLLTDDSFNFLRSEPRFQAIVRGLKFPSQQ